MLLVPCFSLECVYVVVGACIIPLKQKHQYYKHIAGKVFIVNKQTPCFLPMASFLPILILTHTRNKDLGFLLRLYEIEVTPVPLLCRLRNSKLFSTVPITTCQQANAVLLALKISIERVFFSAFFPDRFFIIISSLFSI